LSSIHQLLSDCYRRNPDGQESDDRLIIAHSKDSEMMNKIAIMAIFCPENFKKIKNKG
jgi:hypothetical protein